MLSCHSNSATKLQNAKGLLLLLLLILLKKVLENLIIFSYFYALQGKRVER